MKCQQCSKSLTLAAQIRGKCKCSEVYCGRCLFHHNCSFDYKQQNQQLRKLGYKSEQLTKL